MRFTLKDAYEQFKRKNYQQAEEMFKQILVTYPDIHAPFFFIGSMALDIGDNAKAIAFLESAASRKQEGQILNNLGTAYRRENQIAKAMEIYHQALELDPENADYLNNMGTLYINEGNPKQGESYFRKAIQIDPEHKHAHWNLSLILLENKQWEEGWKEYKWGLLSKDRMNRWSTWPDWMGENYIEGERGMRRAKVLIYGEQGLGDEIMFASMYPDAINTGAKIYAECHFRLQPVFERSFPEVTFIPSREQRIVQEMPEFDYVKPIGGLGELFRNRAEDFPKAPYLKLDSDKIAFFRGKLEKLGKGPYIGVGWRGGSKRTRKEVRSLPLREWAGILDQRATFVSLQYNIEADTEVQEFNSGREKKLAHWAEIVREDNYDDILSLMAACDLVVHVNGTAVHGCGAIGQDCWTLTPSKPAWRYSLEGDTMVWYSSVRQLRQENGWESLINRLNKELREYIDEFKSSAENTRRVVAINR